MIDHSIRKKTVFVSTVVSTGNTDTPTSKFPVTLSAAPWEDASYFHPGRRNAITDDGQKKPIPAKRK